MDFPADLDPLGRPDEMQPQHLVGQLLRRRGRARFRDLFQHPGGYLFGYLDAAGL